MGSVPVHVREFIRILACPLSGAHLDLLDEAELAEFNQLVDRGQVTHADGSHVQHWLDGALATTNRELVYPIFDNIITLLPNLVICDSQQRSRIRDQYPTIHNLRDRTE